jgi:carboxyl-terminal processing protease
MADMLRKNTQAMSTFFRSFLITSSVLLTLATAFLSGYLFRDYQITTLEEFPVLLRAYEILASHGIKTLPESSALEYGMIRGMVQAYNDPYTQFVEPAQHELETNSLQGSFGGIGVSFEKDHEGHWVLYPYPDSPALAAGVQEGDRLLAVEALPVEAETPVEAIQSAIRGKVGEQVNVTIARLPDYQPQNVRIRREEIPLPSVTWRLAPGEPRLGIVRINIIAASTPGEIKKAYQDLEKRGATHFALDLRSNPGGLLDAGVEIARLFLKDGEIIQQQYRGREVETFVVEQPGPLADSPMVVLINQGSASAAEIIAGALRARDRAILIGSPSFGKDTIQLVFELPDKSSMHVTAANWWIPEFEFPRDGKGLWPDVLIEENPDASTDVSIQAAVQYFFPVEGP